MAGSAMSGLISPPEFRRRLRLLERPLLVVVGDSVRGRAVDDVARGALAGGARFLELRLKGRPKREVYEAAERLVALCHRRDALLVVNDEADVASAAGADGVHLGQSDLPPDAARRIVGPEALVGLSVHTIPEAARAADAPIDYVGVGTLFASRTKPDLWARGPENAGPLLLLLKVPAYAVGGIDARNVAQALRTGVHGVAVGSAIVDADDPAAATREMLALVREARGNP